MRIFISEKEYHHAKDLEKLGIPLDNDLLERSRGALRGFDIDQDPNIPQSRIFDAVSGGTGTLITLSIQNRTDRTIRLNHVRLDIPWCEKIYWLEDPKRSAPAKLYYTVPNPESQRLEHDSVLNHRIGKNHKLYPGDRLLGFLLGIAPESIPADFVDRSLIRARLSMFDTKDNAYTQELKVLICRELKNRTDRQTDNRPVLRSRLNLNGEGNVNSQVGSKVP
jgi:hypothetical protein